MKFRLRKPIPWSQIMKITFSQILIATMLTGVAYSSTSTAQERDILNKTVKITMNARLLDVLKYLQKNSNVHFIYSKSSIDVSQKVSIESDNKTLKEVLDQILKQNGIDYEVIKDRIILGRPADRNQNRIQEPKNGGLQIAAESSVPITGKVSGANGQGIAGATLTESGTTNGTVTGVDGTFHLNVASERSIITVSLIGYTSQQITVGAQTNLTITLIEDVKSLNEVVVVGFGTQKKRTLTGAVSGLKTDDIQDQQVVRADQALQGRVSGVNVVSNSGAPNQTPQIRVRGTSSLTASDPLYIIDGIAVDNGGLDNVNPNDIESIDVLKDASAAIYGSRASNGVILITTKKGRLGAARITYSAYAGFQAPVRKVQLTNASQYATLRNESVTNDGGTAPFADPSSFGVGTNWQNQIFSNNALVQSHNLSISGATEKVNYYTSFGYFDQKGIVDPTISNYKRLTITNNLSYHVKNWLFVGENLTYSYTRNQQFGNVNSEFGGPLSSAVNLDPITPLLVADPSTQPNPSDYANPYAVKNAQGQYYGISNYVHQEITNPLAYLQTQLGNYNYSHNLLGSAFIEIAPYKDIKIRSQISAKQAFYGSDTFTPLYYLNSSSNNTSLTSHYQVFNRNLTWNWDNTITYTHSFGRHNLTALIGTSAQSETVTGLSATFNGEPVNTFGQASFNFALPAANRIAGGGGDANQDLPYTLASTFARITYDYDQKYLFTGIIRRDGSSKFGSNNIYGIFPSGSIGWVISKENFFSKNGFVDFLKIRGSYGIVGNEMALSRFQYSQTIGSGRNYVSGTDQLQIGYSPNAPANPNLKWEQTSTTDIGLDALFLRDFNLTFDWYNKQTSGLLQQVQLPAFDGFTGQPTQNVGNISNKGFEIALGYNKHIGDFNLGVNGNLSYNKNMVTNLGSVIHYFTVGSVQSSSYEIGRNQVGQPAGAFYGFSDLGIFHSQADVNAYTNKSGGLIQPNAKPGDIKWADLDGDGAITSSDRKFLGNPLPTYTYGINLNAGWKGIDLKVFGQGAWGNKIFSAYRRLDIPTANYPIAALNAWTAANPNSNYPRLSDNDPNNNFKYPSNFYLQSGAYFRIKTLQVGYTFPKAWFTKAEIQRLRVYVSSNNLATITGYKGFDPEIQGGIDKGIYPQARTFSFGLDVSL